MAPHHHYQSPRQYLPDRYTFYGATCSDLPAIVSLLNHRHISPIAFCVDDLQSEWRSGRFNPAMDVRLVFDPREYLVGFMQVSLEQNQPFLWGCVHPDYEGRGIGSALLFWGEARVHLALEMLPAARWAAPHFSTLPVQQAHELCEHLGWRQIRPHKAEIKKVTGALHLPETAELSYDVYEKAIEQLN